MLISDWSSDVCSSDLIADRRIVDLHDRRNEGRRARHEGLARGERLRDREGAFLEGNALLGRDPENRQSGGTVENGMTCRPGQQPVEIGRASGRERVCQYV